MGLFLAKISIKLCTKLAKYTKDTKDKNYINLLMSELNPRVYSGSVKLGHVLVQSVII